MDDIDERLRKVEGRLEDVHPDLEWARKVRGRADGAKFWGGIIIAVVIGWNAFTGGLQSMISTFTGGNK